MPTPANPNLLAVDWSKIPAPIDDGAARHLEGSDLPDIALPATDGSHVSLARCTGASSYSPIRAPASPASRRSRRIGT
jgi:hypothetical protein